MELIKTRYFFPSNTNHLFSSLYLTISESFDRFTNTISQSKVKYNASTFSLWDSMISQYLLQHKLYRTVKIGTKLVIKYLVVVALLRCKYLSFIHIHLRRSTTTDQLTTKFFTTFWVLYNIYCTTYCNLMGSHRVNKFALHFTLIWGFVLVARWWPSFDRKM
jgi:hypothetical protein